METTKTSAINHKALKEFCCNIFIKAGLPASNAHLITDTLVEADLRGVHSHGVIRLPIYIEKIIKGETMTRPNIFIEKDSLACALVNGGNGLGQIIAAKSMKIAIDKAKNYGVSWVGVNGSNHFGRNAYFAEMALPRDMIGIVFTISNLNTMAPWGGLDLLLGNNPVAFAIPTNEEYPVVFDTAFSVAAKAKIIMAVETNTPTIPEGWALDSTGIPTTDPQKAMDGILMSIGGYKGTGFSFIISILAGVLNNAAFGNRVSDTNVGHAFCAINIKSFRDIKGFKKDVDSAIRELKTARLISNKDAVCVPGEREYILRKERVNNGIPLHNKTIESLNALSDRLKITIKI